MIFVYLSRNARKGKIEQAVKYIDDASGKSKQHGWCTSHLNKLIKVVKTSCTVCMLINY